MKFKILSGPVLSALWLTCLLTLGLAFFAGCGAGNPFPRGSYERGALFAEQHKYPEAVASLEAFVRHNPADSLAAEAQFLKGMTYMQMKEYPLAAVEFQILAKDYPTSDKVEDAAFQEAMAYYHQVGRVERDVTGALEARLHLLKFSQAYPQSSHMDEVISVMRDISDLMVTKRLKQAQVYDQLKKYDAVVLTLGQVLEDEANSRLLDQVLWVRGQAAEKTGQEGLARDMYQRLVKDFPESEYRTAAQRKIDQWRSESPADEG